MRGEVEGLAHSKCGGTFGGRSWNGACDPCIGCAVHAEDETHQEEGEIFGAKVVSGHENNLACVSVESGRDMIWHSRSQ